MGQNRNIADLRPAPAAADGLRTLTHTHAHSATTHESDRQREKPESPSRDAASLARLPATAVPVLVFTSADPSAPCACDDESIGWRTARIPCHRRGRCGASRLCGCSGASSDLTSGDRLYFQPKPREARVISAYLVECLAARVAGEGANVVVDQEVRREGGRALEGLQQQVHQEPVSGATGSQGPTFPQRKQKKPGADWFRKLVHETKRTCLGRSLTSSFAADCALKETKEGASPPLASRPGGGEGRERIASIEWDSRMPQVAA